MTKQVCDGGCGRESPDERGLHAANGWYDVRAKMKTNDYPALEGEFCEECVRKYFPIVLSKP